MLHVYVKVHRVASFFGASLSMNQTYNQVFFTCAASELQNISQQRVSLVHRLHFDYNHTMFSTHRLSAAGQQGLGDYPYCNFSHEFGFQEHGYKTAIKCLFCSSSFVSCYKSNIFSLQAHTRVFGEQDGSRGSKSLKVRVPEPVEWLLMTAFVSSTLRVTLQEDFQ